MTTPLSYMLDFPPGYSCRLIKDGDCYYIEPVTDANGDLWRINVPASRVATLRRWQQSNPQALDCYLWGQYRKEIVYLVTFGDCPVRSVFGWDLFSRLCHRHGVNHDTRVYEIPAEQTTITLADHTAGDVATWISGTEVYRIAYNKPLNRIVFTRPRC